ncbi:hypothetical protein [Cryptosporangium sp. NPDC051539]|uniref:hypothetical protein n=1 Tax=Cryptosporangium sp. NPDC051539 TaxID=3363962 RepID=UPI0037B1C67D
MSGKKTSYVSVDQDAWRNAQRAAARLSDVRKDLPRMLNDVREQTRRDAEQVTAGLSARQSAAEASIAALSAENQRIETETNRRLAEQSARLMGEIRQESDSIRADTTAALARQESALRGALAAERRQREQQVAELRRDLADLQSDRVRAQEAAAAWISDAGVIRDLIRKSLPHERFAPGQLDRLDRELATVQNTHNSGMGEAALAGAQRLKHALDDLRLEVIYAKDEWDVVRLAAGKDLRALEATINHSATVKGIDATGTEDDETEVDVDYWSDGALQELRDEVHTALASTTDASALTTDQLRVLLEERQPELVERLNSVLAQAKLAQLSSQLRTNVADTVVGVLVDSGYQLDGHTFAHDDQREAFYAKVVHPDGSEVVIDVSPRPEQPESSQLRILTYDEEGSDEIRRVRADELAGALRQEGLDVPPPREEGNGIPDERFRGIENLRRGTAGVPARASARQGQSGSAG